MRRDERNAKEVSSLSDINTYKNSESVDGEPSKRAGKAHQAQHVFDGSCCFFCGYGGEAGRVDDFGFVPALGVGMEL